MKKTFMKHALLIIGFAVIVALMIPAHYISAQSTEQKPEIEQQTGADNSPEKANDKKPKGNPIMQVLDADKDGELSASEIENASNSLKALDKNGDNKLSGDELPRKKDKQDISARKNE